MRKLVGLSLEARATSPMRSLGSSGILIGRDSELATLREAFSLVSEGKTVLVHVRGEPGIGKTALVKHFTASCAEQPATLLAGRCYEGDLIPFNAVHSLIDLLQIELQKHRTAGCQIATRKRCRACFQRWALHFPSSAAQAAADRDVHAIRQSAYRRARGILGWLQPSSRC